jgi:anti-anti-sigma factor
MMKLTLVSDDGGVLLVRCEGQISQLRFQVDGNPFEDLLGAECFRRPVLLDLERAEWIDSSGISWLIVSHKRFLQAGGALVLHTLPPRIRQVLQFCRMDKVFNLAANESEARNAAPGVKR